MVKKGRRGEGCQQGVEVVNGDFFSVSDGDQGWVNGACWAAAGNLSPTSICTEEARRLDGEGGRVEEARRLILPSLTNVDVLVVNLHSRVS